MSRPRRYLFRFLGLAAVLLISATFAVPLIAGYGKAGELSRAAYDRIKLGMARPEAEAVLGDWPRQGVRAHGDCVTVGWEAPDGATIEVDFDARGRVTGKQIAEDDSSLAERVKRLVMRFPFR
jgi:hypothetical protein